MKHRFLFFGLILTPFFSLAQGAGKNFRLAFTVSPTFGKMEFADGTTGYVSKSYKAQLLYGVMADFGIAKNYYFGTGFTVTTVGATVDVALPQGSQTIDYRIQYAEIPLTLKLKSNEAPTRYYGQFGLDAGVKVSNKHSITSLPIPRNANTFRLGLLFGAGVEWHLTQNMNVITGVSYNQGLSNVFDNPETKNSFAVLNLGVYF